MEESNQLLSIILINKVENYQIGQYIWLVQFLQSSWLLRITLMT